MGQKIFGKNHAICQEVANIGKQPSNIIGEIRRITQLKREEEK